MSEPPRVVLDTGVVLSALVFASGRLAPLRDAWRSGRCTPLLSRATASELVRAIAYPKFHLSPAEQNELLGDYLPYCSTIRMPARLPATPRCRDAGDVPFLQLALVGRADALVTGDADLLSLASAFPRTILTPARFLAEL